MNSPRIASRLRRNPHSWTRFHRTQSYRTKACIGSPSKGAYCYPISISSSKTRLFQSWRYPYLGKMALRAIDAFWLLLLTFSSGCQYFPPISCHELWYSRIKPVSLMDPFIYPKIIFFLLEDWILCLCPCRICHNLSLCCRLAHYSVSLLHRKVFLLMELYNKSIFTSWFDK